MSLVQFTQIQYCVGTDGPGIVALDQSGRLWGAMFPIEEPGDWELLPMPEKVRQTKSDYEKLLDMQNDLRQGLCPDGLEPAGDVCPRCNQKRRLKAISNERKGFTAWVHVDEDDD